MLLQSSLASVLTLALVAEARPGNTQTPNNQSSFDILKWVPSVHYAPVKSGVPFTLLDKTAQPWVKLAHAPTEKKPAAEQPKGRSTCSGVTGDNPSTFWYETINHNGQSSFLSSSYKNNYKVFRNVVKDFGADNTGKTDASTAIQNAINAGASNGPDRTSNSMGTTGKPAMVYLPGGTYLMNKALQLYVGTVIIGDPLNPPRLKASSSFPSDHLIYGKDPNLGGTINFYIGVRNIILDSTSVSASKTFALLDWTVSQATQLTNVVFDMPDFSSHVGLTTQYDSNSNLILNDLTFTGGSTAMELSGQQWILKGITINGANTGIKAGAFNIVCFKCSFSNGAVGIDASGVSGSMTMIDSTGNSLGTLVTSSNGGGHPGNSIILDHVTNSNSGATVTLNGKNVLSGDVANTWVHGDLYSGGSTSPQYEQGLFVTTDRVDVLLDSNFNYAAVSQPTFEQFSSSKFTNIKSVPGLPVMGDGVTDDTANINAILAQSAGCSIVYFPAGTYIVTDTIFVPENSIITGDPFASAISAVGSRFWNPDAPVAMVQVGNPHDSGIAQITDMLFTVADVLQGCKLLEVNAAGASAGDVGIWNSHFRIGGAAGSKVETNCGGSPDSCKAAWGLIHLTNTSSAYIENMWGWTADHDLDGNNGQTISTGRGMLIEASFATWLVGTAMEHHTLYQYNFDHAANVFSAFQQSETPYWQGWGGPDLDPAPWSSNLISSDPNFSNCAAGDAGCRMAFFERIRACSNLFLYGGCVWAFFNGGVGHGCNGDCQANAIRILDSESTVYLYGTNTKSITNLIVEGDTDAATESANGGGWGGVVAAYLHQTSSGSGNNNGGGSTGDGNSAVVTGKGLNWYNPSFTVGNSGYQDPQYYYCFSGPASNFPPFQNWMNYQDMFNLNQKTSMAQEESGPIQGDIWNAIQQVSIASKVDARLILAVIMQESTGSVYVGCTNNGIENCGLMQAFAGSQSFDPNDPQGSITNMIIQGTQGTSQGGGLVQWFNNQDTGFDTSGNPYEVCRGYNSGSINYNDLSDAQGATASYASDIANRLQGWNGNDGEGYRAKCGYH